MVNKFNFFNFAKEGLSVFSSDDEITVDENGAVSATKLATDKIEEITKHRYLLVSNGTGATSENEPVAKESTDNNKDDNATGTMKSGGNPIIFIVIGVLVVAGVIAFVVIRKNKAPTPDGTDAVENVEETSEEVAEEVSEENKDEVK